MLGLEVVKKVAEGSAVEAFLARTGEGQVLVQVSRPELAGDPELYGRFLDQTRTSTKNLAHPALLSARTATCSADGRFVLTSQPLSGRTARDHLRERGPLSLEEAARWTFTLADALEYLHAHGVVHGHLSPANVFLDGDPSRPEVKLLDTGLLLFRSSRSFKSSPGLVLVPAEYLSPERVAGQRGSARSDVYGLGVLVFELLTGAPPFTAATPDVTRDLHLTSPMPELPPGVSRFAPLLERCLAKDPRARFATMVEVREALHALIAPAPPPSAQRVTTQRAPPSLARLPAPQPPPPPLDSEVDDVSFVSVPAAAHSGAGLGPGGTLGSYLLEAQLGEGGMGQVFVATHRTLGRKVAIKVLRPALAREPEQVKRFVQEAQAVNRVQHPHIVQVHDLVQESAAEGGRVYFVMELLEGDSLKALGKQRPLELPRVLRLIRQAADALAAAHQVGVIHRDIKPDNLFVTTDAGGSEQLKVLDFGVARVRDANRASPRQTQTGQVVGTPLWMAPEQVLGGDVDARADIYALITVLYVLLARRFPFDGVAMSDVVMQRLEREAKSLGAHTFLGEPVPPALKQLVAECLARDLSRRPSSMAEVAHRLRDIEAGLQTHVTSPFDSPPGKRPSRLLRWIIGGALAGSAIALGVRFLGH
ncbi:MAG: serine/threonine-protein kinase [Myxococcota bacterium]